MKSLGHGKSNAQQRIERQMELAALGEARRRKRGGSAGHGTGAWIKNLVALAFGLAVIAVVFFMAWQSGLIG
jgi:hypothetical protein